MGAIMDRPTTVTGSRGFPEPVSKAGDNETSDFFYFTEQLIRVISLTNRLRR